MVKGFLWNCCACTQDGILATFNKSCMDCGHKICEGCVYYRTSGYGTVLDEIQHVDLQNFKGSAQNEWVFSLQEAIADRMSKASKPERQPKYFARITWEGNKTERKDGKERTGHWGHSSIPKEPETSRPSSSRPTQPQAQPKPSKKAPKAAASKPQPTPAQQRPKPPTTKSAPAAAQAKTHPPTTQPETQPSKAEAITFVDTLGRKFHFPFELCKTWQGMQGLIRSACVRSQENEQMVRDGNYPLISPNGDIILPQVWEMVVQPGWTVSMQRLPAQEHRSSSRTDGANDTNENKGVKAGRCTTRDDDMEMVEKMRIIEDVLATMRISEEDCERIMDVINDAIGRKEDETGW